MFLTLNCYFPDKEMLRFPKQFCFHQLIHYYKKKSDPASLSLANNHRLNWVCIRDIILDFIPNASIHFLKKCPKNGILGNQGKTLTLWNKSSKQRFYAYLLWLYSLIWNRSEYIFNLYYKIVYHKQNSEAPNIGVLQGSMLFWEQLTYLILKRLHISIISRNTGV